MYGMVNKAFRAYFKEKYGDDKWSEIIEKADTSTKDFLSMEQYPDSDSVALIVAGCEVLQVSPENLLEELGGYWIEFAFQSDYGEILRMAGNSLPDVLTNLDSMHVRVGNSFPNLKPPSFWISERSEDSLVLNYSSSRESLAYFVVGLVRGLAKHFDQDCTVEIKALKSDGADGDKFLGQYSPIQCKTN